MAYVQRKNLLQNRDTYNRYYGNFRGVDFSSDHTQVHEQRLAYAVNMYRDYQSGQGEALETVPGFRRRVEMPDSSEIYAIHRLDLNENGAIVPKVLIHAADKLYLWHNYPRSIGVKNTMSITLHEEVGVTINLKEFAETLPENVYEVYAVSMPNGEVIFNHAYDAASHKLTINSSELCGGDTLHISYYEGAIREQDALFSNMNTRRSQSIVFNNRLYIIDGKNYLVYDGQSIKTVKEDAYVPTTYINIIPGGVNADAGAELEQRNVLQPKFKNTFIGDGETYKYYLNEHDLESIDEVKVYGKVMSECYKTETGSIVGDYTVDLDAGVVIFRHLEGGISTTSTVPKKPEKVSYKDEETGEIRYYPEGYAGIEITASKKISFVSGVTDGETQLDSVESIVHGCTVMAVYDGRIFLSGNTAYPNHVFYCERNDTGHADPSYFGALNYMQDGVGNYPVTGMIPVADSLMVLKSEARQDGAVYFHSASETGLNLQPKIYPSAQGLAGIGCLGACVNFLDDPVFLSRLGLDAVGQLSVRYERAIEHRSSLIDAKLVNLDLSKASLEEWNGYLVLLIDGKIFLADSRQRYTHESGNMQYEWYYLEDIGIYEGQYTEYRYASELGSIKDTKVRYCSACLKGEDKCTCGDEIGLIELDLNVADNVYDEALCEYRDLRGQIANPPSNSGTSSASVHEGTVTYSFGDTEYTVKVYYVVHERKDFDGNVVARTAYLCEQKGNKTGGVFKAASVCRQMDDNLFFGTVNGVICSFNFDMRDENGEIPQKWYSFDGRTIFCGCATKMDSCNIPHLTKNTVKKSTVIKTKTLQSSAAKIKVRTNKKPYSQIARINSTVFSFDNMDFSDFSFIPTDQSLFAIKEKEKKWVEKQYYLYSDEYLKPFALYYISFRYCVAGRYKE